MRSEGPATSERGARGRLQRSVAAKHSGFLTAICIALKNHEPREPSCREQLKATVFLSSECGSNAAGLKSFRIHSRQYLSVPPMTQAYKYPVCWVDRKRRSCFCGRLCRRGPTIAESWAKRFVHTASEPVSRKRNWPSGLACTTISSVKSNVETWRFH